MDMTWSRRSFRASTQLMPKCRGEPIPPRAEQTFPNPINGVDLSAQSLVGATLIWGIRDRALIRVSKVSEGFLPVGITTTAPTQVRGMNKLLTSNQEGSCFPFRKVHERATGSRKNVRRHEERDAWLFSGASLSEVAREAAEESIPEGHPQPTKIRCGNGWIRDKLLLLQPRWSDAAKRNII
ncbi:hypothetical protein BSKO_05011 [Bryopsis sp. KO-2023]|nr:hypothetical protein BSKO_05011 [Bryopsis sp. KO-2023]